MYVEKLLEVPDGLVFASIDTTRYQMYSCYSQGSQIPLYSSQYYPGVSDFVVLQDGEYTIVRHVNYEPTLHEKTISWHLVANSNGQAVQLRFSPRAPSRKKLARWHKKANKKGFRFRVFADSSEPVFGGLLDEIRAKLVELSRIPSSEERNTAMRLLEKRRAELLHTLWRKQQVGPNYMVQLELQSARDLARDIAERGQALELALQELDGPATITDSPTTT